MYALFLLSLKQSCFIARAPRANLSHIHATPSLACTDRLFVRTLFLSISKHAFWACAFHVLPAIPHSHAVLLVGTLLCMCFLPPVIQTPRFSLVLAHRTCSSCDVKTCPVLTCFLWAALLIHLHPNPSGTQGHDVLPTDCMHQCFL